MCTISGSRGTQTLLNLPIDKLCEKWYNGKFGAPRSSARRQFYHTFGILSIGKNVQKMGRKFSPFLLSNTLFSFRNV
jgi:hypothetical protein